MWLDVIYIYIVFQFERIETRWCCVLSVFLQASEIITLFFSLPFYSYSSFLRHQSTHTYSTVFSLLESVAHKKLMVLFREIDTAEIKLILNI
jgi:hypothetical protein